MLHPQKSESGPIQLHRAPGTSALSMEICDKRDETVRTEISI